MYGLTNSFRTANKFKHIFKANGWFWSFWHHHYLRHICRTLDTEFYFQRFCLVKFFKPKNGDNHNSFAKSNFRGNSIHSANLKYKWSQWMVAPTGFIFTLARGRLAWYYNKSDWPGVYIFMIILSCLRKSNKTMYEIPSICNKL